MNQATYSGGAQRHCRFAGVALLVTALFTIVAKFLGNWEASAVAKTALLLYLVLMFPGMGRTGQVFVGISVVLLAIVSAGTGASEAVDPLGAILENGCFVVTFFVALGTAGSAWRSE